MAKGEIVDQSWGQDVCPKFSKANGSAEILFYVNASECGELPPPEFPRFCVMDESFPVHDEETELYKGNDPAAALAALLAQSRQGGAA